jgi:hypothetical protein
MRLKRRIVRLEHILRAEGPALCPHLPSGVIKVRNGLLVQDGQSCPCGRPRGVLAVAYDSEESERLLPLVAIPLHGPEGEPVTVYTGVDLDLV